MLRPRLPLCFEPRNHVPGIFPLGESQPAECRQTTPTSSGSLRAGGFYLDGNRMVMGLVLTEDFIAACHYEREGRQMQ